MATTRPKGSIFPGLSGNIRSHEDFERQFLKAPLDAAKLPALGTVMEVASLLELLPEAFTSSRRRELARITATAGEQDPRAVRLQESLGQVEQVRIVAQRGRVRLERMAAVPSDDEVFHGFVADANLAPLEGVSVHLTGGRASKLSANTDADGYFRIVYGTTGKTNTTKPATEAGTTERINGLFARLRARAEPSSTVIGQLPGATVEIVRKGTVIHRDNVPVAVGEGRIYREYVITDTGEAPTRPPRRSPLAAPSADAPAKKAGTASAAARKKAKKGRGPAKK